MKKNHDICVACGLRDTGNGHLVEAGGVWCCKNPLCSMTGAIWFRHTLNSYVDDPESNQHSVDPEEWVQKGILEALRNPDNRIFFAALRSLVKYHRKIHLKDEINNE